MPFKRILARLASWGFWQFSGKFLDNIYALEASEIIKALWKSQYGPKYLQHHNLALFSRHDFLEKINYVFFEKLSKLIPVCQQFNAHNKKGEGDMKKCGLLPKWELILSLESTISVDNLIYKMSWKLRLLSFYTCHP